VKTKDLWNVVAALGSHVRPELRQWAALRMIVDLPGSTVGQVALGAGGLSPTKMTSVVNALSARGLVRVAICPTDRRNMLLYATPGGERSLAAEEDRLLAAASAGGS